MNAPAHIPLPESTHYRVRAYQCRVAAAQLRGDLARRRMLNAAAEFDRIAEEARNRELAAGIAELGELVSSMHRPQAAAE